MIKDLEDELKERAEAELRERLRAEPENGERRTIESREAGEPRKGAAGESGAAAEPAGAGAGTGAGAATAEPSGTTEPAPQGDAGAGAEPAPRARGDAGTEPALSALIERGEGVNYRRLGVIGVVALIGAKLLSMRLRNLALLLVALGLAVIVGIMFLFYAAVIAVVITAMLSPLIVAIANYTGVKDVDAYLQAYLPYVEDGSLKSSAIAGAYFLPLAALVLLL
jgi:hypothetical protein